jgi:acyl carrier protein
MLKQVVSSAEIERILREEISQILEEKPPEARVSPERITREQRLGPDLGLTSLDLAQLVAVVEGRLEADPFQELVPITSVRNVGDLCKAYERFFSGNDDKNADAEMLLATKRRAEARRATDGG